MKKIFIDVETTGLDCEKDYITELAAIYEHNGKVKKSFHVYCKPYNEKPEGYERLESIGMPKWELLEKLGLTKIGLYEFFKAWLNDVINKYDKKDKAFFYGYNARFDRDFCYYLFKNQNDNYFGSYFHKIPVDIMALAVDKVASEIVQIPENFKLQTMCKLFNISLKNSHSAMEDVQATMELYYRIKRL